MEAQMLRGSPHAQISAILLPRGGGTFGEGSRRGLMRGNERDQVGYG